MRILGIEPDPGIEGRRPRGDATARRRGAPAPPPAGGDPGGTFARERRERELGGPVPRADGEHHARATRTSGAGGSALLSRPPVVSACLSMASTGEGVE